MSSNSSQYLLVFFISQLKNPSFEYSFHLVKLLLNLVRLNKLFLKLLVNFQFNSIPFYNNIDLICRVGSVASYSVIQIFFRHSSHQFHYLKLLVF